MKRKGASKWCWLAPGKFPVYSEAPNTEDDILYPDSDSDYDDPTHRRLRLEAQGQRYLQGKPVFLLSTSLRGPFTKESGWTNPWTSSQTTTRGGREIAEAEDEEELTGSPAPLLDTPMHESAGVDNERPLYSNTSTKAVAAESQSVRPSFSSSHLVPTIERPEAPSAPSSSYSESAARVQNWREEVQPNAPSRDEFWSSEGSLKRSAATTWLRKQNENKTTKRRKIQELDGVSVNSPTPAIRQASELPNPMTAANSFSSIAESLGSPQAASTNIQRKKTFRARKSSRRSNRAALATEIGLQPVTAPTPAREASCVERSDGSVVPAEENPGTLCVDSSISQQHPDEMVNDRLSSVPHRSFAPSMSMASDNLLSVGERSPQAVQIWKRHREEIEAREASSQRDADDQDGLVHIKREAERETVVTFQSQADESFHYKSKAPRRRVEPASINNETITTDARPAEEPFAKSLRGGVNEQWIAVERTPLAPEPEAPILDNPSPCPEGISTQEQQQELERQKTEKEMSEPAGSCVDGPTLVGSAPSNATDPHEPMSDENRPEMNLSIEKLEEHKSQMEIEVSNNTPWTKATLADENVQSDEQAPARLSQLKSEAINMDDSTPATMSDEIAEPPPTHPAYLKGDPAGSDLLTAAPVLAQGEASEQPPDNVSCQSPTFNSCHEPSAVLGNILTTNPNPTSLTSAPGIIPLESGCVGDDRQSAAADHSASQGSLTINSRSVHPETADIGNMLDASPRNTKINGLPEFRPSNSALSTQPKAQSPWVKETIDVQGTFQPTVVEEPPMSEEEHSHLSLIASQVLATIEVATSPLETKEELRYASQPLPHTTRPFNPLSSPVSESGFRELEMSALPDRPACSAPELRKSTPPSQLILPSTPETKQSSLPTPDFSVSVKSFNPTDTPTPTRRSSTILPISLGDGRLPSTQVLMDANLSNPWLRPSTHKSVSMVSKKRKAKRVSWAPLPGEVGHNNTPARRTGNLSFKTPAEIRAASPPPELETKNEDTTAEQKFNKHFSIVATRRLDRLSHLRGHGAYPLLPSASQQNCPSPAPDAMAEAFVLADTASDMDAAGSVHDDCDDESSEVIEDHAGGLQDKGLLDGMQGEGEDDVSAVLDNIGDFLNYADVETELGKMSNAWGKENRKPPVYSGRSFLSSGMMDAGVWD